MADDTKTKLKPLGFLTRAVSAVRWVTTGKVDASDFFGPLDPLSPVAPREVEGRRFDYTSGFNLITRPRGDSRIDFHELRALADNYDLMRLVIETRKDQLVNLNWSIQPRDAKAKGSADPRIKEISDFLAFPDKENDWDSWLRALAEDMLVIDAATLYPRRTFGGALYALDIIDGATIKPVIDDHGRRPLPPEPAYQQVLKGLPAVDYSAEELLYLRRNLRSDRVYGYPPVEQVVMSVNIALRRQMHQLQFYTEGTVPDALIGTPETWSPDQVSQFQAYWDSLLEGNTAQRRHARFVPGGIAKSFVLTKDGVVKDEYDEWLARIICYAFNVSNQWAIKMMSRATAETADKQASQEGLAPLMKWVKSIVDRLLAQVWLYPDLEFQWEEEDETEPSTQATVAKTYLSAGVKCINEVRDDLGLDPIKGGDEYLIYTASGAVKLDDVLNPPQPTEAMTDEDQVEGADNGSQGGGAGNGAGAAAKAGGNKVASGASLKAGGKMIKAALVPGALDRDRPAASKAEGALALIWEKLLGAEAKRIAAKTRTMKKAAADDDDNLDSSEWAIAQSDTAAIISQLAQDGVSQGYAAIGVSTNLANPRAVNWATDHAVELVKGLKDTTRAALQKLVAQSESEGWSVATLAKAIEADTAFSPERAQLIAHMETRTADIQGNLIAWRQAKADGVAVKKRWLPRGDNICPECIANEADGAIDADDTFTSGDDGPPAHVNCECDVEPEIAPESEETQS